MAVILVIPFVPHGVWWPHRRKSADALTGPLVDTLVNSTQPGGIYRECERSVEGLLGECVTLTLDRSSNLVRIASESPYPHQSADPGLFSVAFPNGSFADT
jgi:hypothetical protein